MQNNPYEFISCEHSYIEKEERHEYSIIKLFLISIFIAIPFLILSCPFIYFYFLITFNYKGIEKFYLPILVYLDYNCKKSI